MHSKLAGIFVLLSLLMFFSAAANAQIYRWKDEQGKLHFSDSLHNVPERFRPKAGDRRTEPEALNLITSSIQKGEQTQDSPVYQGHETTDASSFTIPYIDREGMASRVIIEVRFNNRVSAPILVDTGSPGLILSSGLAEELGITGDDTDNLLVLISGIGGQQVAARTIIDNLTIGEISEKMIPAHIIPDQSDSYRGLIGMDILAGYSVTIDSANKRLVARKLPASPNRPGGRGRAWWQRNFHEFAYYRDFWQKQEDSLSGSDSPYSRLTSEYQRVKDFIHTQKEESQKLYNDLERFARSHSVPRHWRQ